MKRNLNQRAVSSVFVHAGKLLLKIMYVLLMYSCDKIMRYLLCLEFQYDPDTFDVTPEMQEVFDWDGCFIVRYSLVVV